MASIEKELKEELLEVGNKLLDPPSSVDNLLHLLCHSNVDVKVALASCFNEITRISPPDLPYNDPQMKEIFRLIVSSFGNLHDKSSRWYSERILILETVAILRLCVVMLDLECDALILEMFQNFFKTIREYHPENVFSFMKTIMVLVLEESEDIALDLLSPILDCLNKKNEMVLPIARKLGESVLESCATRVKPYIRKAVNKLGISLNDYSDVLASVCMVLLEASENVTSSKKHAPTKKKDSSVKEVAAEDISKKVSERKSDSEVKPACPSAKKGLSRSSEVKITTAVDAVKKGSGKTEERTKGDGGSSSRKPEDKQRKGQVEGSSEKGPAKSSSKEEDKVTVSSLKSAAKATKDEHSKETPKTNLKRKRTPGKEKGSDIKKNVHSLVGKRVKVWWPKDNEFYKGVVDSFDSSSKKHKVSYDNGDVEVLNFEYEKWEIDEDENVTSSKERSSSSKGCRSSKKTQTSSGSEIKGASKSSSSSSTGAASEASAAFATEAPQAEGNSETLPNVIIAEISQFQPSTPPAQTISTQSPPSSQRITNEKPELEDPSTPSPPPNFETLVQNTDPSITIATASELPPPQITTIGSDRIVIITEPEPDTTTTIELTNSESSPIPSPNISLNLPPPSTYPEIEDFSKIIFGQVKELLDERSRITNPMESDLKWDNIRTQVDDFLVSLKESSKPRGSQGMVCCSADTYGSDGFKD